MTRQIRKDDPALDLVGHARAVIAGRAKLDPTARREMACVVGHTPDHKAPDQVVARAYLAARGLT